MERLKNNLENLTSMLKDLDIMLEKLELARNNPAKYDSNDVKAYRNSVIKSFELSYELFWKTLKIYLSTHYGVEINSPKGTIHQCEKQTLISNDETKLLLAMADVRNMTTHDYDQSMAEKISKKIPEYYAIMIEVTKKINSIKSN